MADNESNDLKRREYHDEDGEIHHHTHPYMEEHGGGREQRGGKHERGSADDTSVAERRESDARTSEGSGHAAHPLTDHAEIRRWAESRGARPSCVKGTGGKGDPGMIRLDFPGFSGADSLQHISWDEWFKAFEENNLELLVQEETAEGQRSNFNKLVSRGRK